MWVPPLSTWDAVPGVRADAEAWSGAPADYNHLGSMVRHGGLGPGWHQSNGTEEGFRCGVVCTDRNGRPSQAASLELNEWKLQLCTGQALKETVASLRAHASYPRSR